MTRQQFLDEITTWYDLIEWCNNHGCSYCNDIYSDEARDEDIDDNLVDMARNNNWYELRDILGNLATGYDYWRKDEYGDWYGVDDEFNDYRNDVLEWADENDEFDEEEEEPIYVDDDDYGDAEFEADTSVSLGDFFTSSAEDLDKITAETVAAETKANADFNKFTQRVTTVGDY